MTSTAESRSGEQFRTATGARVVNEGNRVVYGATDHGKLLAMKYSVANIAVPLESVSQICDSGSVVVFNASGGYVIGPAGRIEFERKGDIYVRRTWVKKKPRCSVDSEGDVPMRGFYRQGRTESL